MTQVDMAPFVIPSCSIRVSRNTTQTISNNTVTKVQYDDEDWDPDLVYDPTTNYRYQPNVARLYDIDAKVLWSSFGGGSPFTAVIYIYKNGAEFDRVQLFSNGTFSSTVSSKVPLNGTTDYVEIYVLQITGGNTDISNAATYNVFCARGAE
jgi:hypothetical protein